ncbi:MAG: class I SAM-dependent methyltransferase [Solirubrobacteraceae bacterium]
MPLLSIGRRVRFRHLRHAVDDMHEPAFILDAGCGDGRLARSLATRYPAAGVVGIDADAGAIQSSRGRAGDSISWEIGEVGSMPLPEAHFDLVVCVDASTKTPPSKSRYEEIRASRSSPGREKRGELIRSNTRRRMRRPARTARTARRQLSGLRRNGNRPRLCRDRRVGSIRSC